MRSRIWISTLVGSAWAVPYSYNYSLPVDSLRVAQPLGDISKFTITRIPVVTADDPHKAFFDLPPSFQSDPGILLGNTKTPNAKLIKIQHGPISMAALTLVPNQFVEEVPKPCDECYITAIQSDVQYEDGSSANVNTGMWLRHMVLYNNAKRDPICRGELYPMPARIYAAANERETNRMNPDNAKYGIEITARDRFSLIYELMNSSEKDRVVFLTLAYEYVEKKDAKGYGNVVMVWLDVMGCQESHFPAREGAFGIRSPGWNSTIKGKLLSATGHLSDGGTHLAMFVNNKQACTHEVVYGRKAGYIDLNTGRPHISDVSICHNFGEIKVGDELAIVANFDTKQHPPTIDMRTNGLENFMALERLYVGT